MHFDFVDQLNNETMKNWYSVNTDKNTEGFLSNF